MAFSQTDVARVRADLGDTASKWQATEIEDLLGRASERYPQGQNFHWVDIATAMGLAQMLSSGAIRFADYVVAEEQRKLSDIWRQLNGTYQNLIGRAHVRAALNLDGGTGSAITSAPIGYTRTRKRADEFANPFA